jgi:pimeloyl-ACP methyl ester carboxylesterase
MTIRRGPAASRFPGRNRALPLWFRSVVLIQLFIVASLILASLLPQSGRCAHAYVTLPISLAKSPRTTKTTSLATVLYTVKPQQQSWTYHGYSIHSEVTEPASSLSSSVAVLSGIWPPPFFAAGNDQKTKKKSSQTSGSSSCSVVLIHGFGASSFYWRETSRALSQAGYTVHALDLLGLGKSDKPSNVVYSTELWSNLVTAYVQENVLLSSSSSSSSQQPEKLVFIGNSLGSVVALSAAISCPEITKRVHGVGLYNCGVGMNSMNLLKDPSLNPLQKTFFGVLFQVLNTLIFANLPLLTFVLDNIVTQDLLRDALVSLYACAVNPQERVDADLVDSFYNPAKDAGSAQALSQIYVNDAGPTPMELHQKEMNGQRLGKEIPIHVIWGNQDMVTPLSGYVGQYYTALAADESSSVTMDVINAGHIPFDEVPECNDSMVAWMGKVVLQ